MYNALQQVQRVQRVVQVQHVQHVVHVEHGSLVTYDTYGIDRSVACRWRAARHLARAAGCLDAAVQQVGNNTQAGTYLTSNARKPLISIASHIYVMDIMRSAPRARPVLWRQNYKMPPLLAGGAGSGGCNDWRTDIPFTNNFF